jgi:CRISPR/Cas system Type II protein with McrA/HNH and RuvC-like nuclease domain
MKKPVKYYSVASKRLIWRKTGSVDREYQGLRSTIVADPLAVKAVEKIKPRRR